MRLRRNAFLKITAGVLSVLMLLLTLLSVFLWGLAESLSFGTSTYAYLAEETAEVLMKDQLTDVFNTYERGDDVRAVYEKTNLHFTIRKDGEVLASSANAEKIRDLPMHTSVVFSWYIWDSDNINYGTEVAYTVEGAVDSLFPHTDRYSVILAALQIYHSCYRLLPLFALAFCALWLFLLIFLLRAVGWHRGEETPRRGWLEYVPFDLLLFLLLVFIMLHDPLRYMGELEFWVALSMFVVADIILGTLFLCTLAVRVKTRTLLKNTVVWAVLTLLLKILRRLMRILKKCWSVLIKGISRAIHTVPLVWRTLLLAVLLFPLDFLVLALFWNWGDIPILICLFLKDTVIAARMLHDAVMMRRIQSGGEQLAAGNLDAKIRTQDMFGEFRRLGETLNRLGEGLSAAVEERMKSERFRTELITNVSHDIKTPLTSIVNYVDLIKKENVETEPLRGYVEVLERQSARLKKLTEDLVEASKAATGNIPVYPEPCDSTVLLAQTAGEYEEKLQSVQLELILSQPKEPVMILADGRLISRIFDNLMNNIIKYALPGTRVYLNLRCVGNRAEIVFRNIARDALQTDSESLLQRFTRGDDSRSTEGSGLGLSIAKSLTELQGGSLALQLDGDLFKVTLNFPLCAVHLQDGVSEESLPN